MITQLYRLSELPDNYYSGKIMSYYKAYDTGYDFCRFYGNDKKSPDGIILVYNMNMVIDGNFDDYGELAEFIEFISPETIEYNNQISGKIHLNDYRKEAVSVYKMNSNGKAAVPEADIRLSRMCEIICCCFEGIVPDLWYTDMSHRIRHNVSKAYMYNNSCAAVDFETASTAFISNTATHPEARGKGDAAALLRAAADDIIKKNKTPYLRCFDNVKAYYDKIGFKKIGEDAIFIRQNKL